MPARNPSAGLPGVEGVLVVTISPEPSSNATTSVNVPPVSMPIRILRPLVRVVMRSIQRLLGSPFPRLGNEVVAEDLAPIRTALPRRGGT